MPTLIGSCSPQVINKKRGRPFGAINKTSESIRWGFVEAYRRLGGVDGLVKWGKEKPDLFYPMLKALLPAELAESGAGQQIRVIVYAPNGQQTSSLGMKTIEGKVEAESDLSTG